MTWHSVCSVSHQRRRSGVRCYISQAGSRTNATTSCSLRCKQYGLTHGALSGWMVPQIQWTLIHGGARAGSYSSYRPQQAPARGEFTLAPCRRRSNLGLPEYCSTSCEIRQMVRHRNRTFHQTLDPDVAVSHCRSYLTSFAMLPRHTAYGPVHWCGTDSMLDEGK